jgi:hypothetical protein
MFFYYSPDVGLLYCTTSISSNGQWLIESGATYTKLNETGTHDVTHLFYVYG